MPKPFGAHTVFRVSAAGFEESVLLWFDFSLPSSHSSFWEWKRDLAHHCRLEKGDLLSVLQRLTAKSVP
jgi:hypothetical protein